MVKLWFNCWCSKKQRCFSNRFFCRSNELNSWNFVISECWPEFLQYPFNDQWFRSGCVIIYKCVFVMWVRFKFRLSLRFNLKLGLRLKFKFKLGLGLRVKFRFKFSSRLRLRRRMKFRFMLSSRLRNRGLRTSRMLHLAVGFLHTYLFQQLFCERPTCLCYSSATVSMLVIASFCCL